MSRDIPLQRRIAWVTITSALLYSLAMVLAPFSGLIATGLVSIRHAPDLADAHALQRCAEDPARWILLDGGTKVQAWKADGRPWRPGHEALPTEALALPVEGHVLLQDRGRLFLGRMVRRTDNPVCAFLVSEAVIPPPEFWYPARTTVSVVSGVSAVMLIAWFFGARPLARRLRELSEQAIAVGGVEGLGALDETDDELGQVSRALHVAHTRIRADAALLMAQREAVEQHLADIAHDVRTPLAALSLVVQRLHAAHRDAETDAAVQECAYLTQLIDNLNQDRRVRAGAVDERGGFDLAEVVLRLGARFQRIGEAHGAHVDVLVEAERVPVLGVAVAVERALGNLVYNAIVHGPGDVVLLLSADAGRFEVRVWDPGPGPTQDDWAGARAVGVGLGLRIARGVVQQHGWSMWTEPVDGGWAACIAGPVEG